MRTDALKCLGTTVVINKDKISLNNVLDFYAIDRILFQSRYYIDWYRKPQWNLNLWHRLPQVKVSTEDLEGVHMEGVSRVTGQFLLLLFRISCISPWKWSYSNRWLCGMTGHLWVWEQFKKDWKWLVKAAVLKAEKCLIGSQKFPHPGKHLLLFSSCIHKCKAAQQSCW